MRALVLMFLVAMAALAVAAVSVYRLSVAGPAAAPREDSQSASLLARATALAENELVRLNAAEMIYRNKVYIHVYTLTDPVVGPNRQCMKLYRHFTRYGVEDIERMPSLLHPITKILVRFDFDVVGTRGELGDQQDPTVVSRVQHDHAFVIHRSESIVREYLCDAEWQLVSVPPLPGRPNFFNSPSLERFGEISLEETIAPPESE